MRLHRFYITEPIGSKNSLDIKDTDLANQLRRVFRLRTGDKLVIFDGSGFDFTCSIRDFTDSGVSLDIIESSLSRSVPSSSGKKLVLFMAMVKKDAFEIIAEKATELGVTDIVPILAERSEKKNLNEDRLLKIIKEASEQSGRGDVPALHPMISLKEALSSSEASSSIVFHTEGEPFDSKIDSNIGALFIGPEGGWSPAELTLFHDNKKAVRCLGPQILRAETAAVAALSRVVLRA